jgi:hypothetical protein
MNISKIVIRHASVAFDVLLVDIIIVILRMNSNDAKIVIL